MGKPYNILFNITRGDILSDYKNAKKGHQNVVGDVVSQYMKERKFLKEIILFVAQLTDTDGVFIDDANVIMNDSIDGMKYCEECIEVDEVSQVEQIIKRNGLKSSKVKALVQTPAILSTIPYKIYYFSCNLDHVLHGNQNTDVTNKADQADDFASSRTNVEINAFFEQQAIYETDSYEASWAFVFGDNNSQKKTATLSCF